MRGHDQKLLKFAAFFDVIFLIFSSVSTGGYALKQTDTLRNTRMSRPYNFSAGPAMLPEAVL